MLFNACNIKLYKITSAIEINKLIKKINIKNYTISNNDKPEGIIWGMWYIGQIHCSNNDFDNSKLMYILINISKYNKIMSCDNITHCADTSATENTAITNNNNTKNIMYWSRVGSYRFMYYIKRTLDVSKFIPFENQQNIINQITTQYNKKNNLTVFLHGEPGTGKSMLCYLLAKTLDGHLCDSWNPTEPNDTIDSVYNEIMPDCSKPLILILEEFDRIIDDLDIGQKMHKEYPIQIRNKIGWNSLLDKIQLGIYPNLILVLTSNKNPKYINSKDISYIRKGRVDTTIKMDQVKHD